MALEDILRRISSDAKRESNKLERKANNEAREILAEAKRKTDSVKKDALKAAEAAAQQEKRRILALAKLEARNIILERKQKALKRTFDAALDKLLGLPENKYLNAMKDMLAEAVASGNEEVIVSSSDRKRIGKVVDELNSEFRASGKNGNLKLSGEAREDIKGGFILASEKIEENNSLSSLLDGLKEELEPQLFDILLPASEKKTKSEGT